MFNGWKLHFIKFNCIGMLGARGSYLTAHT